MTTLVVTEVLSDYPADSTSIVDHLEEVGRADDAHYAYNLVGASLSRHLIGHGLSERLGKLENDFTGDSWTMSFWDPSRSAQERIQAHMQGRVGIVRGTVACKRCKQNRVQERVLYGRSDEAQGVRISCTSCGYSWKE